MANDEGRVLKARAKGVAHESLEVHARRTVPEGLGELAPPWQLELLQEAMKDAGGNGAQVDDRHEPGWALYQWQPLGESQAPPPRGVDIATSARRLMALERRRMRRPTGANSLVRRPRTPSRGHG